MEVSIFKALSHPIRLEIISILANGQKTSGELAAMFDVTWPTISNHLNLLTKVGLVEAIREANSIHYHCNLKAVETTATELLKLSKAEL